MNQIEGIKIAIVSAGLLLLCGCNTEDRILESIFDTPPASDATALYRARLAAATYVMHDAGSIDTDLALIRKLIDLHSFNEARSCIAHVLQTHPDVSELHYLEAICLRNENQYNEAYRSISAALNFEPGNQNYLSEKQNIQEEWTLWRKKESLDGEIADFPSSLELRAERAMVFVHLRLFDEGRFDAHQILKSDSSFYTAYYVAGISNLLDKRYVEAEMDFRQLVQRAENDPELPVYRDLLDKAKKLTDASEKIKQDPSDIRSYITVARELSSMGEYHQAHQVIDRGLISNMDHPNLLHARLFIYIQEGKMDAARETVMYMESAGIAVDAQLRRLIQ